MERFSRTFGTKTAQQRFISKFIEIEVILIYAADSFVYHFDPDSLVRYELAPISIIWR